MSVDIPSIAVIGAGRLGSSLVAALVEAALDVRVVARGAARRALEADLVFLAVPDRAIGDVAAGLPWQPRHRVVHCSGAMSLDVLAPVARAGGLAGCLHPLQSFPSREPAPERFLGITCGVEGVEPLGGLLERIVGALGARVVRLEGIDRAKYHVAAVFASNYVVALMALARRAWADAGLPEDTARTALAPLLRAAAENVSHLDLPHALTGPIARGDFGTIDAHLAALAQQPEAERLYRALGLQLLSLPLDLPDEVRQALEGRLR